MSARVLLVLIAALGSSAVSAAPMLACAGPFARDASEATLKRAFGAANVRRAAISVGEGASEPGTLVFADDPSRRIEILWHDEKQQRRPALIRVGAGALWRFRATDDPGADGATLGVGTALAAVEAANGRPFTLSGFEWDFGGFVTDWRGGRLATPPGGCLLSLQFEPGAPVSDAASRAVAGDRPFSSASRAMRTVKPVVTRMSVQWAQ